MTEPLPGAPIPASSTEGYTIRIPKLRLSAIKGNRTYALAIAVALAAVYALSARLRGIPLDLSMLPQIVDLLLTDPTAVIGSLLAGQLAAHRAGVKGTEARLAGQIEALRTVVAAALAPAAQAAPEDDKRARLKALLAEAERLQSEIEPTKGDTPT